VKDLIDVHFHAAPPRWLTAHTEAGGEARHFKDWSPARSVEDMDAQGCSLAMISVTTPGVWVEGCDEPLALARECNEYMARMVADYPARFGMFALLPLPDIDASLNEIRYALDVLKADGIGLFTSYFDKWLGDPAFDPIFEELDRRRAVVYTHPTCATCCENLLKDISPAAIEYGTDTTRAIVQFIFSGASQRFPNIRMIFSHAGGTMPFLVNRFINLGARKFRNVTRQGFLPEAARFYYDTAQVPNAPSMLALRETVPVSRIVFGTDYPYHSFAWTAEHLETSNAFSAEELDAIAHGNAAVFLLRANA
jgi:predicted TIM-barrel fold metal-dependent hydrolase